VLSSGTFAARDGTDGRTLALGFAGTSAFGFGTTRATRLAVRRFLSSGFTSAIAAANRSASLTVFLTMGVFV